MSPQFKAFVLAAVAMRSRKAACHYLQDYQWRLASPALRFAMLYRGFLSRYTSVRFAGFSVGDRIYLGGSGNARFCYLVIEPACKIEHGRWRAPRLVEVGNSYEPGNGKTKSPDHYYEMYHYDTGPMGSKK